jgi:hypothetical protein
MRVEKWLFLSLLEFYEEIAFTQSLITTVISAASAEAEVTDEASGLG